MLNAPRFAGAVVELPGGPPLKIEAPGADGSKLQYIDEGPPPARKLGVSSAKQGFSAESHAEETARRPAGFVPLSGILRDCSLIVHHGGSGTTASALHYGVPQLIVPGGAGNELCAQRVGDRKVGLSADPSTLDASVIRELAERLLAEESFRQEAAEVRAEMAAQPSPAAVIDRIAAEIAG
ncbi:hypothetical protein E1288_30905 [Saccharopolyspora elongata]|uniref:Erythromycin biosynthesis protein CIII-like C-terminal domain-containing protein n=1 Tax=Saccharopolyspora elongata TaxID=2530387 RepID=A0A4R4YDF9_9PSEU|nr:hypothetical protein E1288_30905 [Saccharopolyspora elongata]